MQTNEDLKAVFYSIRTVGKPGNVAISLFREHSGRNNDTIEYATFRHTIEVENGLNHPN